jgi:glycosyltransferase involved in cell wall biosynthesis
MSKTKILIITEVFYPEEFLINDLALSLSEKGLTVSVLTLNPSYPSGKIHDGFKNKLFWKDSYKGIDIYRMRAVTGYKLNNFKKLMRYLNFMLIGSFISVGIGKKFDFIFGYNLGSLTDMVPAVIIRKLYKKPIMFWVQDIWPESVYAFGIKKTKIFSTILNGFVRFMYRNVDSFGISSQGFRLKLLRYVDKDIPIKYIPNWNYQLDMEVQQAILSSENKIHFTFAGNLGKVQNLENIISAFNSMSIEYQRKSQLNLIGDGSVLENLKILARNNQNIIFHGRKHSSQMASFYKASDFLIISLIDLPIFSETVPAKMQTYIAAKKPILAFINGESAEIVNDNKLGLHASPSDVKAISKVFEKCIDMPDGKKEDFTLNCQTLLSTTFNKKIIIDKISETIISK